jgi:hypothetical protein
MSKLILSIMLLIAGGLAYGQNSDCKVLMPQISGSYSGDCKKGLAQGKGIAKGVDTYEGRFDGGLPDGKGIYTWADGSTYNGQWKGGLREGPGTYIKGDSVVSGYWKANKYQGKKQIPSYRVTAQQNVTRSTFSKGIDPGNGIRVRLLLGGSENPEVDNFSMATNSGSEYRNMSVFGLQNCTMPINVTIRYSTYNQLHTIKYDVLFEFTISDPGSWDINITTM